MHSNVLRPHLTGNFHNDRHSGALFRYSYLIVTLSALIYICYPHAGAESY